MPLSRPCRLEPCSPRRGLRTVAIAAVSIWLAAPAAFAGESEVTITRLDGKMRVEVGGKLFTEYCYKDYAKPICYPVIGPHGVRMTRDYPMSSETPGEAHDHPHQRSLWFTHGDVNGHSFWHEGSGAGTIVHDAVLEVVSGEEKGVIRTRNKWIAGKGDDKGKTVCTDETRLTFFALGEARALDFEITITASEGEVVFGDTKEGTLGIRTHPELRLKHNDRNRKSAAQALNSEGHRGGDVWGKRAKWVDYWAPIDGKIVGVAIFDHPKNPVHPTWWHARDYGLIAANPFGVHDFDRTKPAGAGNLKIEAGKSVTFRYRFVFHPGSCEEAKIAELYESYTR